MASQYINDQGARTEAAAALSRLLADSYIIYLERFPLGLNWDSKSRGKAESWRAIRFSGMRHDEALFGGFASACG